MDTLSVALQNNLARKQTICEAWRTIAGRLCPLRPPVSAEPSSSGLKKRTHSCLTLSEINLQGIKNKRAAVLVEGPASLGDEGPWRDAMRASQRNK